MDRKTWYCQDVNSSQFELWIQYNSTQNPRSGYQYTNAKVYTESQETQSGQLKIEEGQGQKTGSTWLQGLLL